MAWVVLSPDDEVVFEEAEYEGDEKYDKLG